MGTDIHLFIEHYRDGQWHHVVDPNANKWSPNVRLVMGFDS